MAVEDTRGPSPHSDRSDYTFTRRDSKYYGQSGGQYNSHSQETSNIGARRSRASSRASSEASQAQPQPLYDAANAVNYAFDRSDAASHVDPKLIAQITEQVKQQVIDSLKTSGIGVTPQQGQPQTSSVPHTASNGHTANTATPIPPRNVYAPPSPSEDDYSSSVSSSPEPSPRDTTFDRAPLASEPSQTRSERLPSTTPSAAASQELPRQERPVTAQRMPTQEEFTTLEKIWQPLFDVDGRPTARAGCFLRGLANHIINDYEPKYTLVITPVKMLRFLEETKVVNEIWPWHMIYKAPCQAISKMYRDLRCQHHFVQDHLDRQPSIPGLTTYGFQTFMEALIQAYPDTEFERLQKAVVNMPISNADDPKERFPKELTRRLLPKTENLQAQQRCAVALSCEGRVPVPKSTPLPPPPPLQTQQPPPERQPALERERSPYGSSSTGAESLNAALSDDDTPQPPNAVPIERERKPYTAKEGTGKKYEDDYSRSYEAPLPQPTYDPRTGRSKSTMSNASAPYAPPSHAPPPSSSSNRNSRTYSTTSGRRPSPTNSYGTRSDGNVGDIPSHHYASNIPSGATGSTYSTPSYDDRRSSRVYTQAEADAAAAAAARSNYPPGPRSVYQDEDEYPTRRSRGMSQSYGSSVPPSGGYSQPPTARY